MLKNLLSKGRHATTRIFSNPCPHSRISTRDESAFQKSVEEQRIHEHILQEEDLEVSSSSPCEKIKEIKESWTTSDEDQILEPEIKEFLACLSPDPLCITECDDQLSKEPYGMTTKGSQGDKDYIETWFQTVIRPQYHSIFQQFLALSPQEKLASHIRYLSRYTFQIWI
jgi:hypothetical protein